MDKDNKRILKNTLFLYFRMLFLLAVNLFTSRLVLSLLGVEDYGIYQIVGGLVLLFAIINGALSSGSSRFITIAIGNGDINNLKKTFNISFECHLLLAFLILIIAETFGLYYINTYLEVPEGRLGAANWIYQFSIISSMLSITQVPYSADIIAHERMNIYAYIGIAEGLFKLLLVGVLFFTNSWDKLVLYGALVCAWSILLQFYYRWFCYRTFPESHLSFIRDKALFKQMLNFSFWDVIGAFSVNGNKQGVNLVINKFFGVVYNASFGLAANVEGIVNQFVGNFMTAVNPQITKDFARNEIDKMKRLVYNTSKLGFFLYIVIGIPVFIEADYLLNLWLVHVPDKAVTFLQLVIIGAITRACARPVITAVHASGNIRQLNIFCGGFSVLINIPVTIVAYETGFPIESTYIIAIFSNIVCNYLELWCLRREISIFGIWEYTKAVYFPCVLVAMIALGIDFCFVKLMVSSFFRLIIVTTSNIMVIGLLCYGFILKKTQRKFLCDKINQKIHITKGLSSR